MVKVSLHLFNTSTHTHHNIHYLALFSCELFNSILKYKNRVRVIFFFCFCRVTKKRKEKEKLRVLHVCHMK